MITMEPARPRAAENALGSGNARDGLRAGPFPSRPARGLILELIGFRKADTGRATYAAHDGGVVPGRERHQDS